MTSDNLLEAAKAALKSWDEWQAAVQKIIGRPLDYPGWPELEALRAAIAHEEVRQAAARKLASSIVNYPCDDWFLSIPNKIWATWRELAQQVLEETK